MDRLNSTELDELNQLCPGGMERNVDLSAISQWRIGGCGDLLLRPASTAQVSALMRWFSKRDIKPVVIGMTSNLLFADEGLRVPILQISGRMSNININQNEVVAQAGAWVPGLARRLMQVGLSGGEHICGIPGTLGGLICMNGGSQRKGIGSNILSVESVDTEGRVQLRSAEECSFGYRRSIFQTNGDVITGATLTYTPVEQGIIRSQMLSILAERRHKFPRKLPNCGSVFKSNPTMYAEVGPPGAIIEKLGFKGMRRGGTKVSTLHANFIVNTGGAHACDVLELIAQISYAVKHATGYQMEAEARYVDPEGHILPVDQVLEIGSE